MQIAHMSKEFSRAKRLFKLINSRLKLEGRVTIWSIKMKGGLKPKD